MKRARTAKRLAGNERPAQMRLQEMSQNTQTKTKMLFSPVCSCFCLVVQDMLHFFVSLDFGLHLNLQQLSERTARRRIASTARNYKCMSPFRLAEQPSVQQQPSPRGRRLHAPASVAELPSLLCFQLAHLGNHLQRLEKHGAT